jgi:predicted transcriptional regulator of viral defense system
MKSKKNLIEQLKLLPYFDKATIYQFGNSSGLVNSTIDTYISRYIKNKEIIQLKKGLYISSDFFKKIKSNISYSFYLANILRTPSYVSSWAALQYYGLTTESIYGVTSVTQKVTRKYETRAGSFSYQSIQKDLFSGFSLVKDKFDFFIASPSKALFDLLYFRTHQFRGITFDMINGMVEDLRIDINEMDEEEQKKFYIIIKKYLKHE